MFAIVAMIVFILAMFGVDFRIDMIALGLAFVAAHLVFGLWLPLSGAPFKRT